MLYIFGFKYLKTFAIDYSNQSTHLVTYIFVWRFCWVVSNDVGF